MTIPTEASSDDGPKAGVPAPVPEPLEMEHAYGSAERAEAVAPRGFRSRFLDYSAHAAMIVGLIGFAWTVGDHVVHRPAELSAKVAVASAPVDPMAELRDRNRELAATVRTMQARLDQLQASVGEHADVAAKVHGLQASLDGLKTGLGNAHSEQAAAVARLDGKIDKLAHEPGSKIQQLVDRLGKLEHAGVDTAPTASLPRSAEADARTVEAKPPTPTARPLPRPAELKADPRGESRSADRSTEARGGGDGDQGKPPVLASWVVRDVYQGVALIEGRRGTLEVVPGVSIPGAGVVKSIDRHGSGWTVTTTKGLVAYAAPAREYRRADRGAYGYGASTYGYDF